MTSRSPVCGKLVRCLTILVLVALLWPSMAVPPAQAQSGGPLAPAGWAPAPPDTSQPLAPTDDAAQAAQWQAYMSAQAALLQWWTGQALASQAASAQAALLQGWTAQAVTSQAAQQALANQLARQVLASQATQQARPSQTVAPQAAPFHFTPAQLAPGVNPGGQPGIPCNAVFNESCGVSGDVQGSGVVQAGMAWTLTARVPPGVPAGSVPVAFFVTTKGNAATVQAAAATPRRVPGALESFSCRAVTAGAGAVACLGRTAGLALQNSQVVVAFTPTLLVQARITGPNEPLPVTEAQRVNTFTGSIYQAITLTEPLRVERVFGGPPEQGFAGVVGRFFTLPGLVTSRVQAISGLFLSPTIGVLNTAEFAIEAIVPAGATILVGLTAGGEPELPQIIVPFQDLSQVQFLQETLRRLP